MLESITLFNVCSIAAASLSLVAFTLLIRRKDTVRKMEEQRIMNMMTKINLVLQDDTGNTSSDTFNSALKTARLTTELQLPRLQNLAKISKHPPEKYKILNRLASQGLGADEIASVLEISTIEASQLLSLRNMAEYGQQRAA